MQKNKNNTPSIKIEIELETLDNIESLFGSVENGSTIKLNDANVEMQLVAIENSLSFDGNIKAEFIIFLTDNVVPGVLVNIIYAGLCKGASKLKINNSRTRITEETITEIVETTTKEITTNETTIKETTTKSTTTKVTTTK